MNWEFFLESNLSFFNIRKFFKDLTLSVYLTFEKYTKPFLKAYKQNKYK